MINKNFVLKTLAVLIILIGAVFSYKGFRPLFFSKVETIEENKIEAKELKKVNSDEDNKVNDSTTSNITKQGAVTESTKKSTVVGELTIPKLKKKMEIFEGTDEDELSQGVGHYRESALPGENNNVVLSGHRDTVFRNLDKLKIGDQLMVVTTAGTFTYKIIQTKIVDKDDRTIIVPTTNETLTLTTCYPFNFIGNAPERYIVSASLLEKKLN